MTVDEIRELIKLVSDTSVAELEVQRGENRVRIRRTLNDAPTHAAPLHHGPAQHAAPVAVPAPAPASEPRAVDPAQDPNIKLVKSPIVGTFYESPSPGTPAFVRVGETVQAGRVLCIIESMKLMNEIEAEFAGVIESRLVPNGQPVEYGEALFAIRPI
jgi:acetyl-CoA carboxylase biotin carboxyl carrier protein